MSNGSLAKRYARAFFALGLEQGLVEKFNQDIHSFLEVTELDSGLLSNAMLNPIIKVDERKKVIAVLAEKMELHTFTTSFISILLDKGRFLLLPEIVSIFRIMAYENAGRVRAIVQTATEISAAELADIQSTLANTVNIAPEKLIIEHTVVPELLGGIIAQIGDTTYDGSIRSKLQDIHTALLQ